MLSSKKIGHWFEELCAVAAQGNERRLLIIKGSKLWFDYVISCAQLTADESEIWRFIGEACPGQCTVPIKHYRQLLGSECQVCVYGSEHLSIDAFAALTGSVVAGGLMILWWPPNFDREIVDNRSLFLTRFYRKAVSNEYVSLLDESSSELPVIVASKCTSCLEKDSQLINLLYGCATIEQQKAVEHVVKVVDGHRNRPLVLTADRGRGKSSALALAVVELLKNTIKANENCTKQRKLNIAITAGHRHSVSIFFQQIIKCLPEAKLKGNQLSYQQSTVCFYPVDQLLIEQPELSLLLIDEAAGIPVHILTQLSKQYHRLVFSSTQHGYEGAGRGFTLKFLPILATIYPQYHHLHLHQAIRWRTEDPVEQLVYQLCLLNCELPVSLTDNSPTERSSSCEIVRLSADELAKNEQLLSEVFSLLVTAHYQTSPSDLRLLLDNSSVVVFAARLKQQLVGIAMLMMEGQASEQQIDAIKHSEIRLRDQFLPQSLLTHCGLQQAFDVRYWRVIRIAIDPRFQGQGLGSQLLSGIEQAAKTDKVSLLGTSFGLYSTLLSFWQKNGFDVVRIGFSRDQASGEHSGLLLKVITEEGRALLSIAKESFAEDIPYWLIEEYQDVSTAVIAQILASMTFNKSLSARHRYLLKGYVKHQLLFSVCAPAIHALILTKIKHVNQSHFLPLLARVIQRHSVKAICAQFELTGKKAVDDLMRNLVERLMNSDH